MCLRDAIQTKSAVSKLSIDGEWTDILDVMKQSDILESLR